MIKITASFLVLFLQLVAAGQEKPLEALLSDTSMAHASVSLSIINAVTGEPVTQYNPYKSLIPASILKLVTSSAALELLGPDHMFKTTVGYTGSIDKRTGRLTGNIVIKGGGDPALGSPFFKDHYGDFLNSWLLLITKAGIKTIAGKVLADDSYFDYQPVPAKWLWEDSGNYYGAGVYGLSVFDNTRMIHLRTSGEGSPPGIIKITPGECMAETRNMLVASGNTDKGYVFTAPYADYSWIAGSVPVNRDDFILKASISDPPLLLATLITRMLDSAGIKVSEGPATVRTGKSPIVKELTIITETESPPLSEIIEVLNHESINLYAEALLKEAGKSVFGEGSLQSGIDAVNQFFNQSGVCLSGIFMEDGSGLSPLDAVSSEGMVNLLFHMKNRGKYFTDFYASLPGAGKEGTLKNYFRDQVFDFNLKAKSGSMTRVRSYAGYFRALSGKEMIFCIIINNYTGSPQKISAGIEAILKETVLNN